MKPIEDGAKEFVNAPCNWLCVNCATDKMSCRFYNDKESFEAGAEWMRKKAVEAFKSECVFRDQRCKPDCKGCGKVKHFIQKLNEE